MLIDTTSVVHTEFAVALLQKEDAYFQVPVSPSVQEVLRQMLQATLGNLGDPSNWETFDCAEQYPTTAALRYAIDDPLLSKVKDLFNAQNLPVSADALSNPARINYYFVHFRDALNNMCVGVRKASQFKGSVGKSLMYLLDGQLTMVDNNIFRLDPDFDFLVFSDHVAIYRPTQFERIADLEDELIKVAPAHINAISVALPGMDFGFAEQFTQRSARARKLIAAIKSRTDITTISVERFTSACHANKISITQKNGKWTPDPSHEVAFLEMLDRRRYHDPLVDQAPENYRAAARNKV